MHTNEENIRKAQTETTTASEPSAASSGANDPDVRQLYDAAVESVRRGDPESTDKLHAYLAAMRNHSALQANEDDTGNALAETGVSGSSASSSGDTEPGLRQLYDVAAKSVTGKEAEFLQKVHTLGHYPRRSRSSPKEEQQLNKQAHYRQRKDTCNLHIRVYLAALWLSQPHPEVEGAWDSALLEVPRA